MSEVLTEAEAQADLDLDEEIEHRYEEGSPPFVWQLTDQGEGQIALEVGNSLTAIPQALAMRAIGTALIKVGTGLLNAEVVDDDDEEYDEDDWFLDDEEDEL